MLVRRLLAVIGILLGVLTVATVSAFGDGEETVVAAPSGEPPAAAVPVAVSASVEGAIDDPGDEEVVAPEVTVPVVADPKELPAKSGKGRRIVYANRQQRVWAVNADGTVARTYRVSGRKWVPDLGEYAVFGKSRHSQSPFYPEITMEYMVRFTISPNKKNNIGFHQIPLRNGKPMQTVEQLGTHLSGGCIRQAPADAVWLFNWARIGTKVVVLP